MVEDIDIQCNSQGIIFYKVLKNLGDIDIINMVNILYN